MQDGIGSRGRGRTHYSVVPHQIFAGGVGSILLETRQSWSCNLFTLCQNCLFERRATPIWWDLRAQCEKDSYEFFNVSVCF